MESRFHDMERFRTIQPFPLERKYRMKVKPLFIKWVNRMSIKYLVVEEFALCLYSINKSSILIWTGEALWRSNTEKIQSLLPVRTFWYRLYYLMQETDRYVAAWHPRNLKTLLSYLVVLVQFRIYCPVTNFYKCVKLDSLRPTPTWRQPCLILYKVWLQRHIENLWKHLAHFCHVQILILKKGQVTVSNILLIFISLISFR